MSTPRPRPSMHNDVYYSWLWCEENAKVNKWFLNMPERHNYRTFYSSFINAVNRAWDSARRNESTLQPLDLDMIVCLLQERIPAEMLIETMKSYNKIIGGNKGNLKGKGLIRVDDNIPELSTIEAAVEELKKKIKSTRTVVIARYVKEDAKGQEKNKGKAEVKGKAGTKVNEKAQEDQEMQDVEMDDGQALPSLDEMEVELTNAGNAPAASKGKDKAPVEFADLPYVGGKKDTHQEKKKKDDDEEWKNFFLK